MTTKLEEQLQAFRTARNAVQDCSAQLVESETMLREARKCPRTAAARKALEEAEAQDKQDLNHYGEQHERLQLLLVKTRRNLRAAAEKIPGLLASDVAGMCGKVEIEPDEAAKDLVDVVAGSALP